MIEKPTQQPFARGWQFWRGVLGTVCALLSVAVSTGLYRLVTTKLDRFEAMERTQQRRGDVLDARGAWMELKDATDSHQNRMLSGLVLNQRIIICKLDQSDTSRGCDVRDLIGEVEENP